MADLYQNVSNIAHQQALALHRLTQPDLSRMSIPELEAELANIEAERTSELEEAQAERQALRLHFEPQIASLQELITHMEKIAGTIDLTSYFGRGLHERAQDAGWAQRAFVGFEGRDGDALRAAKLAVALMDEELAKPIAAPNGDSYSRRASAVRGALYQKQSAKAERLKILRDELSELGVGEP